MTTYTWLCRTELDRERMVATVRWVGPARALMFLILLAVLVGSSHDTGWLPLIPLLVCAAGSIPLYRHLERRRLPEYWAGAAWLITQISLGVGIALTGGPRSPALPWLAVAVISLIARFSRAGILAGLAFLFVELVVVTFGMDPAGVWDNPSQFLYPIGLLFSVGVFSAAQMRSDLDHRDYDKTTGLPNQAKFSEDLRLAILRRSRRGGTVTVLAIDLDGFGLANKELGPRLGDELLRQAGSRIARAARSADLVARRSADEFLVFIADLHGEPTSSLAGSTPRQTAQAVARAIQAEVSRHFLVGGQEVYMDACVGISTLSGGDEAAAAAAEQLLAEAESALSTACATGTGTLVFFDHERASSGSQLVLISRLRKAIDRDELVMRYQPSVELHSRQLRGVEALVRWEDPERGVVAPAEFIGVAEETGLIEVIGAWGFEQVCRQAREWQDAGHVFDVAFNLSPRQLRQPGLVEEMLQTIGFTGVDPKQLIIEITESSALQDADETITLTCQLAQHGLRLAIDDFGVGLSSLSRLRDMPASFLKIDQSFVADLETSPTGVAMIRSMVQLAENLGMEPHAEGIETEGQAALLLQSGCEQGQGFLFSGAISADEVLGFDFRARQSQLIPALGASAALSG